MAVASPLSIGKSTNSLRSVSGGVSGANRTIKNIGGILFRRTKFKRESIETSKTLTNRRIEKEDRADRETELEAQSLVKTPDGAQKLSNYSGGSFLDRIVGFLGYTTAGWILNNLPTWIGLGKEFIARIQKAGQIISSVASDAINIVGGFGNVLGAIGKDILSFDILDSSKRLQNAVGDLNASFEDMGKQFNDGFKLVSTPLTTESGKGTYSQANVPETGTPSPDQGAYPETPMPSGGPVSGIHRQALDILAKYEAAGAGYNAMNQGTIPDAKGQQPKATVRGKTSRDIIGKNLTDMTIGEVISRQSRNLTNDQGFIHAAGRYQIIGNTLPEAMKGAGLKPGDMFSPENQDKMGLYLLRTGGINKWEGPKRYATAQERSIVAQAQRTPLSTLPASQIASIPQKTATGGKVIQYLTGDRTSPRYRADHGAGNYHDHLAFDSKTTRDAAIKWLRGKGWTIGSINTGKHAYGSYHYSNQAFDIPFYPNQSRKGVPDNVKGETALSSRLRSDLISGGFSGSQLGGSSVSSQPSAQVASRPSSNTPQQLTPERTGQDILVFDTGAGQSPPPAAPSDGGGGGAPTTDDFTMVNNFIKKQLLLDLVYL